MADPDRIKLAARRARYSQRLAGIFFFWPCFFYGWVESKFFFSAAWQHLFEESNILGKYKNVFGQICGSGNLWDVPANTCTASIHAFGVASGFIVALRIQRNQRQCLFCQRRDDLRDAISDAAAAAAAAFVCPGNESTEKHRKWKWKHNVELPVTKGISGN